jgi:hypothetical protein
MRDASGIWELRDGTLRGRDEKRYDMLPETGPVKETLYDVLKCGVANEQMFIRSPLGVEKLRRAKTVRICMPLRVADQKPTLRRRG